MLELWALFTATEKLMLVGIGAGMLVLEYLNIKAKTKKPESEGITKEMILATLEAAIEASKDIEK